LQQERKREEEMEEKMKLKDLVFGQHYRAYNAVCREWEEFIYLGRLPDYVCQSFDYVLTGQIFIAVMNPFGNDQKVFYYTSGFAADYGLSEETRYNNNYVVKR
jgi:hypothetical protein